MNFSQIVAEWQPFYATIAEATATLLGLLFVETTRTRIAENADDLAAVTAHLDLKENTQLMSLARQTFAIYLFILTFSITILIPKQSPKGSSLTPNLSRSLSAASA